MAHFTTTQQQYFFQGSGNMSINLWTSIGEIALN